MKAKTLHALRTSVFLPPLALAMCLVLVTGQLLNCCRLNESLSTMLGAAFKTLTASHGHAKVSVDRPEAKSHLGCHGHGVSTAIMAASIPVDVEGPRLQAEESCLSELAYRLQALPNYSYDLSALFPSIRGLLLIAPILGSERVETPRPQNKSSPPIYLLTLRFLV
ncbi:MAG TPA: hypothetical protein VK465_09435 [Fibrobacteria bacterium]|nr:hypothetical protein [Fibrobacteria bacterium]